MLARKAICERCGVSEDDINFKISESGKPYVKNMQVEFNISHSADMIVCATDGSPIEVDIEKLHSVDLNTAKHIFTH